MRTGRSDSVAIHHRLWPRVWQIHHAIIPRPLHPYSIGIINGVAVCGGLVGPYLLGLLHDRAGLPCPYEGPCLPGYGPAFVVLGFGTLLLALLMAALLHRPVLRRAQGQFPLHLRFA